jgi:hypothetical protein
VEEPSYHFKADTLNATQGKESRSAVGNYQLGERQSCFLGGVALRFTADRMRKAERNTRDLNRSTFLEA